VKALKVALVGLLLALLLMPAIGSVTYALVGDRCEDEARCPGCPPGHCWICATLPDGIQCYKPEPNAE
jgi:hypothetical protein